MFYTVPKLLFARFLGFFIRWVIRVFAGVKLEGRQNLKINEPYMFACNHISYIDPPVLCAFTFPYLKYPLKPAATRGLFVFPISFFLWIVRAVPINRQETHHNLNSIKQMIKSLKQEKQSVLIFPEGGIPDPGDTARVRDGIGLLIQRSRSPVVPAYISGTDTVFSKKRKWLKRPRIEIRIGEPIDFGSMITSKTANARELRRDVSKKVMKAITDLKKGGEQER